MLQKARRLTAPEVRAVIARGRSARTDTLSLRWLPARGFKAAVVVSKKVAGGAVDRNALRRMIYALLSEYAIDAHVVVFVQKSLPGGARSTKTALLRKDVSALLAKVADR